MTKVDIVIVNWNSGFYLKECLASLILYNENEIGQIIVVDNNSSDNSIDCLSKNKIIRVIKEKKNLGFGKACNIGARYSTEKYLLFLNPDTKVFKNTIKNSIRFMEQPENYKIGILGVKMVDEFNNVSKSCSYFPSVSRFFFKSTGLDKVFKTQGLLMKSFNHSKPTYVDQVIGAFFLIRSKLFLKLNGFDERFFLYFEEVDLALRSHKISYKSFFNPDILCFHKGGVSTDNDKVDRQLNYLKSRILFCEKHFSFFGFILSCFITLFLEFFSRLIYATLRMSREEYTILFKSYSKFFLWLLKKND